MTAEEILMSAIATLPSIELRRQGMDAALTSAEQTISYLHSLVDNFDGQIDAVQTETNDFMDEFEHLISKIDLLRDGTKDLLDDIESLPRQVHQSLSECEGQLTELAEGVISKQEEAAETIQETIEEVAADLRESISDHVEAIQEFVGNIVEEFSEKAEDISEQMTELREKAEATAKEMFSELLPNGVGEKADAFMKGVGTLKEMGLDQLSQLTESVEVIQDKTRSLIDLVEQVKPVLEVARQIL